MSPLLIISPQSVYKWTDAVQVTLPYLKILIGNRDDKVKEGTTNLLLYKVFHMEIDSSVEKEH